MNCTNHSLVPNSLFLKMCATAGEKLFVEKHAEE